MSGRAWNSASGAGSSERCCEVCGGKLTRRNKSGVCQRTPECVRMKSQKLRRAQGIEPKEKRVRTRLFSKLAITPSGCLIWTGQINRGGYGHIKVDGRMRTVHSVMWELYEGPVPSDLELDHICHSRDAACRGGNGCIHRRCANLSHLEIVSRLTNTRRAMIRPATRAGFSRPHSSKYIGVSWSTKSRKWQAHINVAGKGRNLGLFTSEEQAAAAYRSAAYEAARLFAVQAGSTNPEAEQ